MPEHTCELHSVYFVLSLKAPNSFCCSVVKKITWEGCLPNASVSLYNTVWYGQISVCMPRFIKPLTWETTNLLNGCSLYKWRGKQRPTLKDLKVQHLHATIWNLTRVQNVVWLFVHLLLSETTLPASMVNNHGLSAVPVGRSLNGVQHFFITESRVIL